MKEYKLSKVKVSLAGIRELIWLILLGEDDIQKISFNLYFFK